MCISAVCYTVSIQQLRFAYSIPGACAPTLGQGFVCVARPPRKSPILYSICVGAPGRIHKARLCNTKEYNWAPVLGYDPGVITTMNNLFSFSLFFKRFNYKVIKLLGGETSQKKKPGDKLPSLSHFTIYLTPDCSGGFLTPFCSPPTQDNADP